MEKNKNWWRNPRNHIFWLVYIPMIALLASVVFNILQLRWHTGVTVTLNEPTTINKEKNDSPILNLSGPRQLQEILSKYPLIQAQETFDKFYRGKTVKWKGALMYAFKSIYTILRVKRGDSLLPIEHLTLEDSIESITEDVYYLGLLQQDGSIFEAIVGYTWHNIIDYLSIGDTLCVVGKLKTPGEIVGYLSNDKQ